MNTPASPKCSFTRVSKGDTTYHVGKKNDGGTDLSDVPSILKLPSQFKDVKTSTILTSDKGGEPGKRTPSSPKVRFNKTIQGSTTFYVAEVCQPKTE